jgi:hypothetical protein
VSSKWLWVLLLACAHAPPRATSFGKRVGLGELVGDPEATGAVKDALSDAFELDGPNPELHLHVHATTSGFDEAVLQQRSSDPQLGTLPRLFRRVQTMRATLRMVDDASGEELALGVYEVMEKGPEQPQGARSSDDLAIILARRVVRTFVETHHF